MAGRKSGGGSMTGKHYMRGIAATSRGIRLPDGLILALELAAARSGHSLSREVIERLEASVRAEVREGVGSAHRESPPRSESS